MMDITGRLNKPFALTWLWGRRLLVGWIVVMAASSYFAYTTIGFDFETATPTGVEAVYYRLRWDDGATWIGRATQPVGRPDHDLDWFDPGGTLLARPSRPKHPRWWNRWGFWWITRAVDDPYLTLRYPGAIASRWVAVPSWLVALGCCGSWWFGRCWSRQARRPRSE